MGDRESTAEAPGSVAVYSPWDDAGDRFADWVIEHTSLQGLHEVMCWRRKVILLEVDRTVAQRRSDLSHALAHVDLGHRDALDNKSERAADRLAAKRLIHRFHLAEALRWTGGAANMEAAEMLRVDLPTLNARLSHLHPAERAYLRRELLG